MSSTVALSGFGFGSTAANWQTRSAQARRRRAVAVTGAATFRTERSPYEVLGVVESASAGEIKAAYRSLAKRVHPDADPDSDGSEFLEIRRAYSALSGAEARGRYDATRSGRDGFRVEPRMRIRRWETDQCW